MYMQFIGIGITENVDFYFLIEKSHIRLYTSWKVQFPFLLLDTSELQFVYYQLELRVLYSKLKSLKPLLRTIRQ